MSEAHGTAYREIVGTFGSAETLETAISALASAGWDRAEMSLLAEREVLSSPSVEETAELADDPEVARQPVTSDTDMRQGRALAAGIGGVVGAFLASGATVMSGGTVLAAVVGAAALGGGAGAAVDAVGGRLDARRRDYLRQQVERGGILLWAKLRDRAQESAARRIMERCGGTEVHVHDVRAERQSGVVAAERPPDSVDTASMDSFPASDPPAWIGTTARAAAANRETDAAKTRRPSTSGGKKRR